VAQAYERQLARQQKSNQALNSRELDCHCCLDSSAEALLRTAMTRLHWSARAYHRVLKVARTIADLDAAHTISAQHIAEAIQYRRALAQG
jgi:magnesium chelatase family protein